MIWLRLDCCAVVTESIVGRVGAANIFALASFAIRADRSARWNASCFFMLVGTAFTVYSSTSGSATEPAGSAEDDMSRFAISPNLVSAARSLFTPSREGRGRGLPFWMIDERLEEGGLSGADCFSGTSALEVADAITVSFIFCCLSSLAEDAACSGLAIPPSFVVVFLLSDPMGFVDGRRSFRDLFLGGSDLGAGLTSLLACICDDCDA